MKVMIVLQLAGSNVPSYVIHHAYLCSRFSSQAARRLAEIERPMNPAAHSLTGLARIETQLLTLICLIMPWRMLTNQTLIES